MKIKSNRRFFKKIGNQEIKVFLQKRIQLKRSCFNIFFGEKFFLGADVVLECTGIFLDKSSAEKTYFEKGGAKKVIISAPGKK